MEHPPLTPAVEAANSHRMAEVIKRAQRLRLLFELECEFARTVSALIPRVGQLELKFMIAQHAWEAMDHARYLRERGREMTAFGVTDDVRGAIRDTFTEALEHDDTEAVVDAFYRVLKRAVLDGYLSYRRESDELADWSTLKLVDEFIEDERRHSTEIGPFIPQEKKSWSVHMEQVLARRAQHWADAPDASRPAGAEPPRRPQYRHPAVPARRGIGQRNSVFGEDASAHIVHEATFRDPRTDPRVIRVMIYTWLMNELTAVECVATVHFDFPDASFDARLDLARHTWDEARHTQFGYRQLPRLGFDLTRLNIHDLPYQTYMRLSPAERYARLACVAEPESFEVKAIIMDRVRELNDFEADTLLAFDRSDEQHHVRYGHRWVPHLMKFEHVAGAVKDFVQHARERFDSEQVALKARPEVMATMRDPHQLSVAELKTMFAS